MFRGNRMTTKHVLNHTHRGTAHPNRIATCICGNWAYDLAPSFNPVDGDVQSAAYAIGIAVAYRYAHHVLRSTNHLAASDLLAENRPNVS